MVESGRERSSGFSPIAAGAILAGTLALSAGLAALHPPAPTHPRTRRWYKLLAKPRFTPPDPVFGMVWPAIETGLTYGGYRLLRQDRSAARDTSAVLLLTSLGMIGGWSELFFGRKRLGASTVAAATMLAGGVAYVASARKVDRVAASMGVPYVLWLGFATALSEEIWRLNESSRTTSEADASEA